MTVVSGLVCLTSTAVSSVNVSILLLVDVGMSVVYNVYNIELKRQLSEQDCLFNNNLGNYSISVAKSVKNLRLRSVNFSFVVRKCDCGNNAGAFVNFYDEQRVNAKASGNRNWRNS